MNNLSENLKRPSLSPIRITAFLVIWALVIPFKVIVYITRPELTIYYAGLWTFLPGGNPISESPLIVDAFISALSLPFYAPGLAVAWFVWHSSKDENLTRGRYIERIMMIVLIQTVLAMIIPCPMSDVLCLPTPTTGIIALLFVSRIVKDINTPWVDDS